MEEAGNSLGQLIMALLFKNKLGAQANYPNLEKSVEESELTGEGAPPAEMIRKNPELGKLYKKRTGKAAPGFQESGQPAPDTVKQVGKPQSANMAPEGAPPDIRQMPGAAVNVPGSTMSVPTPAYPKTAQGMNTRAAFDQQAGRPLPQPFEEEVTMNRMNSLSIIQQRNPELAGELATRYGVKIPDAPVDAEKDTQFVGRVNAARQFMEDYENLKWTSLEPFVYYGGKLPNFEGLKRRPKDYKAGEDPQMTQEAFLKLYQKPIMDKYKDDPAMGMKMVEKYLTRFKESGYRWTPESEGIIATFEKPMTAATAGITARAMQKVLGGDLGTYIKGIQEGTITDETWKEFFIRQGKMDDERIKFGMFRALLPRNKGRAMELLKSIYELRGLPQPKNILEGLFKKLIEKEANGEFDVVEDPLDILAAAEAEFPGMRRNPATPPTVTGIKAPPGAPAIIPIEQQNRPTLGPDKGGPPTPKKKPDKKEDDPYFINWIR
jgi:hypothetical protein